MDPNSIEAMTAILTQFGAAGLIGLLWVLERRTAMQRDRQLQEAHDKLMAQRQATESLLQIVKDNTAAMKSLEYAQRRLIDHLNRAAANDHASAA